MGLFSTKKPVSALLEGMTDFHCHILPGVDDGFKTMEDSLAVLDLYSDIGIRELWFTPHVMEDFPNRTPDLKAVFDRLVAARLAVEESHAVDHIKLHLASEHMMDALFDERLSAGDVLPLGEGRLLVETSYFNPPYDLYGILGRVKSAGFFPVLAHPERYVYMSDRDYEKLKGMGVLFQLNLSSLIGHYGPDAAKKAESFLSKGLYDFVGTDLHRASSLKHLLQAELKSKYFNQVKSVIENSR